MLRRNESGDVTAKYIKEERDLAIIQETLEVKNSDWFQWDAVLMVEGGTEKKVIDIWAKKLGLNLDSAGIKLFVLGGKDKVLYSANATILDDLEIPYAVLLDSDEKDPNEYREYLVKITKLKHENCFILNRREIENYYPKNAVTLAFPNVNLNNVLFEDDSADVKAQLMSVIVKSSEVAIGQKVALVMEVDSIPAEVRSALEWLSSKIIKSDFQYHSTTLTAAATAEQ